MADFLEVIESISAESASIQKLFGTEGVGVRGLRKSPEYMKSLGEAADLVAKVYAGRKPVYYLQEAMTTSDFPLLFADIMDRQVLAAYREAPSVWPAYARRKEVRDFRAVKRFPYATGGEAILTQVAQDASYPESKINDSTPYTYAVKKYGRRMPFAWETLINDDLDQLKDTPARFGRAARATEDYFATSLHVGTTGPDGTFYSAGNGNVVTANPALSVAALTTAFNVFGAMTDADGKPIVIEAVTLEVCPALEVTARNILNATEIMVASGGGSYNAQDQLRVANWMKNRTTLVVNPWIPIVATSSNGTTTWFLHATADESSAAMEVGFLRGHSEPEIFMKSPNAMRVGGGEVNAMDGDFDTDSIQYKVRHVLGGCTLDPKLSVGSQGDGS